VVAGPELSDLEPVSGGALLDGVNGRFKEDAGAAANPENVFSEWGWKFPRNGSRDFYCISRRMNYYVNAFSTYLCLRPRTNGVLPVNRR
jgi:hypothetical protein